MRQRDILPQPPAGLELEDAEAFGAALFGFLGQVGDVIVAFAAVEAGGIGLHLHPERAAEQLMHRLPERLAGDVP